MKNIVLTFLGVMIGIYTLSLCFSVYSLEIRKNALEEHVARVLARTLEEEYRAKDAERVHDKLLEELQLDIGKNGNINVEIGTLDLEKGIIHVVVQETFRQFNGIMRTITCEKTAIMDYSLEKKYNANVYSNAYDYYQEYQGAMLFKPTDETEAGVFFGTKAKLSSTGKLVYESIGWRVTVKDVEGQIIDQVYYSMEGQYILEVDDRTIDGYKYQLYTISLNTLKERMSPEANEALKRANCSIIFDACIVVKRNGVRQGGMTDEGIEWGVVYTIYDGIVNAQNWTAKTKEALKSFYNKEMADMFYDVNLSCGTGVASVSGGGKYCYGTQVTIHAVPESGYRFLEWNGSHTSQEQEYSFIVYEDVNLEAIAAKNYVEVNFYRNHSSTDAEMTTVLLPLGEGDQRLVDTGWKRTGYYQTGWSTSRIIAQPYFDIRATVAQEWLERVAPDVDLYATWKPNSYRIVYDGNEATESQIYIDVDYTESITLPSEGFHFTDGNLVGWSLGLEQGGRDFVCGSTISIAELAEYAGVVNTNGAIIRLYARKDNTPQIIGEQVYVSLADAIDGKVTERLLSQYVYAVDYEDGRILYGKNTNGEFGIVNFREERYLECTEEACFVEEFYAQDSAGNEIRKNVKVYVVEDVKSEIYFKQRRVRFISKGFYKDQKGNWIASKKGGLSESSIWRVNPEFSEILDELFQK